MRFIICILTSLFSGLLSPSLYAMDGMGIAFKASFSGTIYKNIGFLFEEDIRPKSDFQQLEWFLSTAEINYKITPSLRGGVGYMSLAKYKSAEELRNRYYFYAMGNHQVGRLKFAIRERFQSTYRRNTNSPTNYLRSMFMISYIPKKSAFSPFAYVEFFNRTNKGMHFNADKIRYSAGIDYLMNTKNQWQLYYRYHTFNINDPVNYRQYVGFSYLHKF